MDLIKLCEKMVLPLATKPDMVSVKEFETDEENAILIQVMVDECDMARIIGKGGKTANAIRTIVRAASSIEDTKKVNINIDHF